MRRIKALKIALLIFCLVNVVIGIIAFSSNVPLILKIAEIVYDMKLNTLEPYTIYVVRMLGIFILTIGIMSGLAARDPLKNKVVIYGNVFWLSMRGVQRAIESKAHHEIFGTPYLEIWMSIFFIFFIAITLFLLLPKEEDVQDEIESGEDSQTPKSSNESGDVPQASPRNPGTFPKNPGTFPKGTGL